MDSLYGDLPPPISNKTVGENESMNSLNKQRNYIEINKSLITPVIVQRKIANIKSLNKSSDNKDTENKENINSISSESKNVDENLKNENEKSENLNNNSLKGDTKIEIININKSIQNDLKKISDRLNRIQKNNKNESIINNNMSNNNEEKSPKNIEINIKNNFNESTINNLNENNIINDCFQNELYHKYFITNANEDYEPSKPNDLNKIIKERKRKKLIMLAEQKKKQDIEQIEETKERDKGVFKDYENNKIYGYDEKIKGEHIFEMEEKKEKKKKNKKKELEEWKGRENYYEINTKKKKKRESESENELKEKEKEKLKGNTRANVYDNNLSNIIEENDNFINKKKEEITVKKDFATRMMEKMGWKKGEGLGKDKQGIKAPLILQKVDKRSGVIVQAPLILKKNDLNVENDSSENKYSSGYSLNNNCTRIIALTNLVTANEVDDTLKEEIEEEASRFGNLLNINIFIDKNSYDALAVKIFCEYESKDQAKSALNTFNGRIFAGRKVEASYVDEHEYLANINNK